MKARVGGLTIVACGDGGLIRFRDVAAAIRPPDVTSVSGRTLSRTGRRRRPRKYLRVPTVVLGITAIIVDEDGLSARLRHARAYTRCAIIIVIIVQ